MKNGSRRTSRIKAWRQISFAKPQTSHGNAVRWGFGFGIKRQFGDSFLSAKEQEFWCQLIKKLHNHAILNKQILHQKLCLNKGDGKLRKKMK